MKQPYVSTLIEQDFSDEEKALARENIAALSSADLGPYATKTWVEDNFLSDGDFRDFATHEEVASATSGKMDATESSAFYPRYSNPEGYLTSVPSEYVTETEMSSYVAQETSAFLTSGDLSGYATEQWVLDKHYITSADVPPQIEYSAGQNVSINNHVISATNTTYSAGSGLALNGTTFSNTAPNVKSDWNAAAGSDAEILNKPMIPTKTSELNNDSGFITSASIPTVNNGTLTIQRNGVQVAKFSANQSGNVTANITVPTDTSNLTNGAGFITASQIPAQVNADWNASSGAAEILNKPSIPSAANNGTLTITQNGTSKGTFTANQSGNVTISLTDTTYENKDAAHGSPDVSLVTAGDKFDWNLAYRQLFKLTKYVTGSEATQGTAIELGEFSWGPGYRLRFTISIEDTTSDYTLGINIPFSTGTNQQWNGWLANTGNYEYCVKTEYRVGSSSPDLGVFGNNGTFPGIGQGKRIGDVTIPRFSAGGIPVGMYRGKFLLSGYSDGVKSFVLDVDLCYKCASSGTVWWGYVSLLPNDLHS